MQKMLRIHACPRNIGIQTIVKNQLTARLVKQELLDLRWCVIVRTVHLQTYFFALIVNAVEAVTAIIPPLNFRLALNSCNLSKNFWSFLSRFAPLPCKKREQLKSLNARSLQWMQSWKRIYQGCLSWDLSFWDTSSKVWNRFPPLGSLVHCAGKVWVRLKVIWEREQIGD